MTTTEHPQEVATAVASGASATERFHADKSPFEAVKDTAPERVSALINEVLAGVHEVIRKHKVTYDEYNALDTVAREKAYSQEGVAHQRR